MPIYDVENRFSYYKSYSDNILVGPTRPTMGSYDWQRNVSGSVVSGSEEWRESTVYSDFLFKVSSSFFRSGEVRYLRLSSDTQSIQDSYMPDIIEIYHTGSYGSGSFVDASLSSPILLFSFDGKEVTGSNNERVNNIEWINSYPFEKKYSKVIRASEQTTYTYSRDYGINDTAENIYVSADRANNTVSANSFLIRATYVGPTSKLGSIPAQPNSFYKVELRFTDRSGHYLDGYPPISTFTVGLGLLGDAKTVAFRLIFGIKPAPLQYGTQSPVGSNSNYLANTAVGSMIEGWRYGIYNGIPTNFSVVFRQNHYGQFRDMLEQRIYTKTYNNPLIGGPMDNNGGINFISGSSLLGESNNYITASIYAASNVTEAYRVNPYGSGIFDKEYRASQPWYDNDPRIGK